MTNDNSYGRRRDGRSSETSYTVAIELTLRGSDVEQVMNVESADSTSQTTPADQTNLPPVPRLRLKLFSAGFSFFAAGANDGCLGSLIPYMLTSYHSGTSFIALLYVATFLGWAIAAATNTHLPQYLKLGTLLTVGATLQLISQSIRAFHPPLALFTTTFFLTGLGQAYQDSHSNTFVSGVRGSHRWLGFIHASYGLGLLISPFVATAVATVESWNWNFFYIFLVGIGVANLSLVLVAFRDSVKFTSPASESGDPVNRNKEAWADLKAILKLKNLWILSFFFFFHLGVATTASGWIVEYLVQTRHESLHQMGYVPSGFYGGLCLGRLALAESTHRWGERRMLMIYSVLCFGLQMIFWLVPNTISRNLGFREVVSKKGLVFLVAQAGAAIFPSLIGLIASKVGVSVLPPIVVGLIVAMAVMWAFVPNVVDERSE
ncbi:hypothetical protein G7Y89_g12390 [Cudoniella acicularis]|uniref:Major facilitator superfamily (MFS) profile domain-containing protein n=1 Tax=Cudoniella acicularis TaxID=354080 RepID=A0A8H4RAI4_9HELO|nr:hypothetical protein G7Y89_g12390 [Cudoniella acicularis]